jgi:hypothetical protein
MSGKTEHVGTCIYMSSRHDITFLSFMHTIIIGKWRGGGNKFYLWWLEKE